MDIILFFLNYNECIKYSNMNILGVSEPIIRFSFNRIIGSDIPKYSYSYSWSDWKNYTRLYARHYLARQDCITTID